MAESIKDQIISKVVAQLATITTTNGYFQTVKLVSGDTLLLPDEIPKDKFPAVFVVDQDETKEWADLSSMKCQLNLLIIGFVDRVSDQTNVNNARRRLENDIEKALFAKWQWDNLATWTRVSDIKSDLGVWKNHGELNITVLIEYFHDRGEPNSQANSPVGG